MKSVFRIAHTEVLEHLRQPWMIFILAANYVLWLLVFGAAFSLIEGLATRPEAARLFEQQLASFGMELDAFLKVATSSFGSLLFTNLPLYVAIMSGFSVIHDRECGTMPFLMLAPVTRRKLLIGKLLGAMALPLVFHLVFLGISRLLFCGFETLSPYAYKLGASPAWWVAYLVGAPASAAFVGAVGTVISALSKDVRTSMQYTSFFIGLLSLGIGYVLVDGIAKGIGIQLAYAAACIAAAFLILLLGAWLVSRDAAVE